jgi:uncharacterized protein YneF (UPF0154 family)
MTYFLIILGVLVYLLIGLVIGNFVKIYYVQKRKWTNADEGFQYFVMCMWPLMVPMAVGSFIYNKTFKGLLGKVYKAQEYLFKEVTNPRKNV